MRTFITILVIIITVSIGSLMCMPLKIEWFKAEIISVISCIALTGVCLLVDALNDNIRKNKK
jgi:hypothetical protein